MPTTLPPPPDADLGGTLGPALGTWHDLLAALEADAGPLSTEWRPSKSAFGRLCLVRRGSRTLAYLTPEPGAILVALVLGERAVAAALTADLPAAVKQSLREARAYAEGRGVRVTVRTAEEVPVVRTLLACKLA